MKKFSIAKKIGMTQVFIDNGDAVPVTVVKMESMYILEHKTEEKQGYSAVVIGYEEVNKESKKKNKPKKGGFKSKGDVYFRKLKEFRVNDFDGLELNKWIKETMFKKNEKLNVKSKCKGKGLCGVIKLHNFSRGPMSHGSKSHRRPGSIGGGTTPGKVFKGTKMAGRKYGQRTVHNLEVIDVDGDVMFIKGCVPGNKDNELILYN